MCIDGASFMHAQGAINVFTDVVLLLYPLPLLPLLKFNKRQRSKHPINPSPVRMHVDTTYTNTSTAALIIIFSIGLIPVVASTMRLCEIVMAGNSVQTGMGWRQADSSWYVSSVPSSSPNPYIPNLDPKLSRPQILTPTSNQITQDMGLGPCMVANRSRHRHPNGLSPVPLAPTTPRLERGQRHPHHDAEYGGVAEVQRELGECGHD